MNRVISIVFAAVGLVSCAFAFDSTGYDYLDQADEVTKVHSFDTAGNWHSKAAPTAGTKYYADKQICMPSTDEQQESGKYSFHGDQLVLGDGGKIWVRGAESDQVTIADLWMLGGSSFYFGSRLKGTYGSCTLSETTSAKPAVLSSGMEVNKSDGRAVLFPADFHGDADQYFATENTKVAQGRFHRYGLVGSHADYYGHYVVTVNTYLSVSSTPGTVIVEDGGIFGNYCTPDNSTWHVYNALSVGAIVVKRGGQLDLSKSCTLTVGNLTLEDGAVISLAADASAHARILVSGSITVNGKVTVEMSRSYDTATGTPQSYDFIKLESGATGTIDPSQFILSSPTITNPIASLPHVYTKAVSGADGSVTLVETRNEIVKLVNGFNSSDEKTRSALCSAMLPGDSKYYWSDHLAPHSGVDYLCSSMSVGIQPPTNAVPLAFAGESLTFALAPADSYSFQSGSKAPLAGISFKRLTISNDRFMIWDGVRGGDEVYGNRCFRICGGELELLGSAAFRVFGGDVMVRIESDVTGDGDVTFEGRQASGTPSGLVELTGDNSAWTGKMLVTIESGIKTGRTPDEVCPSENNYATLIVREGKNLGGPLAAFAKDALKVNQMCKVRAVGDVDFTAANRGVMIEREARFEVDADRTFIIGNQLTMAGVLRKEGAGTLALGGPMRFIDGEATTAPLATTNVVRLMAGSLKPLATNAFDGASILVENNDVKFVFDNAPAADGLQAYGLVDTKWENAVTLTGSATKINVEFTADDDWYKDLYKTTDAHELGLFTVKTEAVANGILSKLNVRKKYPKAILSLGVRPNANGSYTVTGTFKPNIGIVLIVR